jgi:hypothetical protein
MSKGKKAKLPKRIAGIKVPKALRKSGGSLAGLVESPAGRKVLAEALMAVAGVLMGGKAAQEAGAGKAAARAGHGVAETGSGLGHVLRDVAGATVGAVAEVVRDAAAKPAPPPPGQGAAPTAGQTGEERRGPRRPDAEAPRKH